MAGISSCAADYGAPLIPTLSEAEQDRLVRELMSRKRNGAEAEKKAHHAVNDAKIALGERGRVWWGDGAPDFNRHLVKNTPYAEWYACLESTSD
jgi:hypothetical protein